MTANSTLLSINPQQLHNLSSQTLFDLATDEGINASAKNEAYGCIFGRDSALTILKILHAHAKKPITPLLDISRRTLLTLATLQGKESNSGSGEQPGKFIHEFRRTGFEHLVSRKNPWYVYPDGLLRNYDSIDSTPLSLIAIYKYWQTTKDSDFLITILPSVEAGLNWITTYGDVDKDFLLEYDFPSSRAFGGLAVQSWTDSRESLIDASGQFPLYPIAPIEVQAYSWLALKLWSDYYAYQYPKFARKLSSFADGIKTAFNKQFVLQDRGLFFGAQALDGEKRQIKTVTANPLLALWADYKKEGSRECILDSVYIPHFVERALLPDLFVPHAGIRTMSSLSPTFNSNQTSYHNGSIWPVVNGLVYEGLQNFGFDQEAQKLKEASLFPIAYFGSPIELYIENNGQFLEYCSPSGQTSCRHQAWSAAALLDMTADYNPARPSVL